MIFRILGVWIAVAAASATSFLLYAGAYWARTLVIIFYGGDAPLPALSSWFLAPDAIIYWFPIPLIIWAIFYTIVFRRDAEHAAFLCTVCFACIAVLFALSLLAFILPFCPMPLVPLSGHHPPAAKP